MLRFGTRYYFAGPSSSASLHGFNCDEPVMGT